MLYWRQSRIISLQTKNYYNQENLLHGKHMIETYDIDEHSCGIIQRLDAFSLTLEMMEKTSEWRKLLIVMDTQFLMVMEMNNEKEFKRCTQIHMDAYDIDKKSEYFQLQIHQLCVYLKLHLIILLSNLCLNHLVYKH